jgi:uncharacterized protein with HEPN domain
LKPLEVRKYLFDIAEGCRRIESFVAGRSFEDHAADALVRSGVERQFEIAGEALSRLLQIAPDLSNRISDTRRIIAFRNRLIHGYASVSDEIVWGVVEANLGKLGEEADRLLSED